MKPFKLPRAATAWEKMKARLFGKRVSGFDKSPDGDCHIEGYLYRGCFFVTKIKFSENVKGSTNA